MNSLLKSSQGFSRWLSKSLTFQCYSPFNKAQAHQETGSTTLRLETEPFSQRARSAATPLSLKQNLRRKALPFLAAMPQRTAIANLEISSLKQSAQNSQIPTIYPLSSCQLTSNPIFSIGYRGCEWKRAIESLMASPQPRRVPSTLESGNLREWSMAFLQASS